MSALTSAIAKSIERDPFFGWLMAATVLGSVGGSLAGITYLICRTVRPEAFQ